MLIVGAKGFAKEILEILRQGNRLDGLAFYDDLSDDAPDFLYQQFPLIRSRVAAESFFSDSGNEFVLGIGGPILRERIWQKFIEIGGKLTSTISQSAEIGSYGVDIAEGCNILSGAIISNDVTLGRACIIYYNSIVTHDVVLGDFVEISPGVKLLGRSKIGSFSSVGSNSVVLPDVKVGENVTIGAGSVVTKDLPDGCVAFGVPARVVKWKNE